jgi:hypothetical protein
VLEEGFDGLGVSTPFVPEGPNNATFLGVNIEPACVSTEEGEFVELDL